ncbi:UNVERIFIED_CONTAM: hypothetical protein Sradi_0662600 [Sesamum radiatum]|uniref:Uncharacterized protein n=1 Tax=Sesamum radiatum TaxID=300843 RepID=A0AAW2VPK3_SESRA
MPPPPTGTQPSSPPPPYTASPPPSVPSSSSPPSISPSSPLNNSSFNGNTPAPPLSSFPTEKPTARSTESGPNITANASRNSDGLRAGGAAAVGSMWDSWR